MIRSFFVLLLVALLAACTDRPPTAADSQADEPTWRPLFDGQTLEGWTPKIRGEAFGEDRRNTFRIEEGMITVGYDQYDGFDDSFGHLFFQEPFSSYRLRAEYRFLGEQIPGGPGWAWRNSGIMVHCQDPATMDLNQDFPLCIEVQLLGGDSTGIRQTANLCTPRTNVVMGDSVHTEHCTMSDSETFRGDQWVTVEVEVYSDSLIRHLVNGDTVMTYFQPQTDPRDTDTPARLIEEGWISLQSESHPVQFRKVEIMPLAP